MTKIKMSTVKRNIIKKIILHLFPCSYATLWKNVPSTVKNLGTQYKLIQMLQYHVDSILFQEYKMQ